MTTQTELVLTLLGTPQVHRNDEPVTGFISDKARALLYYLAVNDRKEQRGELAALFWPGMSSDQALKNLRQVLHNLQKLLSPHLLVTRQTVAFDHSYPLTSDFANIRKLLATGTQTDLEAAVELANGELLAGFSIDDAPDFAAWLTEERAYLQQQLADALITLAHRALCAGSWAEAIPLLRQWLQWEPWHEMVGQWLMAAQARCGDYNGALRTFLALQQQLRQELDVEPDAATLALRERILKARIHQRTGQLGTTFAVGRETQLAQIRRHFANHLQPSPNSAVEMPHDNGGTPRETPRAAAHKPRGQLLTLTGLGGMGKTHLARAVADEHRHTFFDGIWWMALTPHTTLDGALTAIAQLLDIDLRAGTDLATQISHRFHAQEALLILDNGEHLPQEPLRAFVKTLLAAAPQLTLLLTSRLPLGLPQEVVLPLTGFTEQSASHQLFHQTAARVGTSATTAEDQQAIADICQLVDGMPLAIQLAATLTDLHSCAAIADQLRADLAALRTAQQDVPQRQRSIRTLLSTTWAERTPAERRALTKLTIFTGTFSRAAARHIAQIPMSEIDHLCDLALLQWDGNRLTIHELLRQHICTQQQELDTAAQTAVQNQFQHYFLTLVRDQLAVLQSAQAATAIGLIAEELGNVQQAWRLAANSGAISLLVAAWRPLTTFYRRRGPFVEGATLLQSAVTALQTVPISAALSSTTDGAQLGPLTTGLICSLQIAATQLQRLAGNFEEALALAKQSLVLAESGQCDWALVDARLQETHALRALGQLSAAQTAIEQAATLLADIENNPPAEARATTHGQDKDLHTQLVRTQQELQLDLALERGQLAIDQGNVVAAAAALEEALALAQQQQDERCECLAACELGYVYMALAKYTEAEDQLRRARHIARAWADTRQESQVLARQARLYRECGNIQQWHSSIETALELCLRIGDLVGEARTRNELGIYYRQQGEYSQALAAFLESLALLRQTNDRPFETLVLQNLGALELICGRYAAAEMHLEEACRLCDELAGIDMQCVLRVYLSWHAAEVGDGPRALAYANAALDLAKATARPAFLIFVEVAIGGAQLVAGDWEAAQEAFALAVEQRSAISTELHYAALSGQAYATWQLGDKTGALALVTPVIDAPWAAVAQQVDTPFYIYWRCYQILDAYADQRAPLLLTMIREQLTIQLARIQDPALRHAFATQVPAHRQLLAAIEQRDDLHNFDAFTVTA